MTWYKNSEQKQIDYSKPILSDSLDGSYTYLLLPVSEEGNFGSIDDIIGYDWFNTILGEWDSCCKFKTIHEATECKDYCNIRNGDTVKL